MLFSPLLAAILSSPAYATCEGDLFWAPVHAVDVSDIEVVGYQLRSSRTVGNRVEAQVAVLARSLRDTAWGDVQASIPDALPGLIDGDVTFPWMPPGEIVESDDVIVLRVPARQVSRLRRWAQDVGFPWQFEADEYFTWGASQRFIDAETDAAWLRSSTDPLGRSILWFRTSTPLLQALQPGDVLVPTPDMDWPGAPAPYTAVGLAAAFDCRSGLPLTTWGVIEGDGLNSGMPGEVGVVFEARSADLPWTGRTAGGASLGGRPDIEGPWDSFVDHDLEMLQDQRICPPDTLPIDTDNDDVVDSCTFTLERQTLAWSPAPDTLFTGAADWRHLDLNASFVLRAGAVDEANLHATVVTTTVQTQHGSDVPLLSADAPSVTRARPQGGIALGPLALHLDLDATFAAHAEGALQGSAAFTGSFADTWVWDVRWTAAEGYAAEGSVSRAPLVTDGPTLSGDADGALTGAVAVVSTVRVWSPSAPLSLRVDMRGESSMTTAVDPAATPRWTTEATARASVGAILSWGGEAPIFDPELSVVEDTTVASAEPGASPGPVGSERSWVRSLDLDTAQYSVVEPWGATVSPDGEVTLVAAEHFGRVITRLDADGDLLWGRAVADNPTTLAALADSSVVAGRVDCKAFTRIDPDGNVIWSRSVPFQHTVVQRCNVTAAPAVGGGEDLLITGTLAFAQPYDTPFAMRMHEDGALIWAHTYDLGAGADFRGAAPTADGGLVAAGSTRLTADNVAGSPTPNGVIVRIDADGQLLWSTTMRSAGLEDVVELPDGTVMATGNSAPYLYSARHGLQVVAVQPDGTLAWSQTYAEDVIAAGRADAPNAYATGDSSWDTGLQIELAGDGGALVLGRTGFSPHVGTWLLRLDPRGEPLSLWMQDLPGDETATELMVRDGRACVVGTSPAFHDPVLDPARVWVSCASVNGGLVYPAALGVTSVPVQPEVNDWFDWQVIQFVHPGGYRRGGTTGVLGVTVGVGTWSVSSQGMRSEGVVGW
jgi:hypothetical protein